MAAHGTHLHFHDARGKHLESAKVPHGCVPRVGELSRVRAQDQLVAKVIWRFDRGTLEAIHVDIHLGAK